MVGLSERSNVRRPAVAIDALNALSVEDIQRRLSGSREDVAAFVATAAQAGSAEAQARFGQMLLDGDGVGRDPQQAFHWFERAARSGHLEAANMVGRCYDLGWGVEVDHVHAAGWFRQAAARGLTWAKYNYATMLALGRGVPEDKAAALLLFREAADDGFAKAHNFVGSFYEDGWVVDRDMEEAARHYAIAAAGGDFRGQFNHGRILAMRGAHDDAIAWMERAWAGGNQRFRRQMIDHLRTQGHAYAAAAAKLAGAH